MMKRNTMNLLAVSAVAIGMMAFAPTNAEAIDWQRKLGRGLANVTFGVVEIPCTVHNVSQTHGGGAGASWGVVKGISRFVCREVVGVYEIVTFPFPPSKPLMRPEFLMSDDKEDYDAAPLW